MSSFTKEQLLTQAQYLCLNRGVQFTAQRAEVLRLMVEQNGSISAYDLLDRLRMSEPKAKPSTIYRALIFLLEQGFIHRIASNNSYIVCNHFNKPTHTSIMLICERCSVVNEKHTNGIKKIIIYIAKQMGFLLHYSVIEARGLCENCMEVETCNHHESCKHDHKLKFKKKIRKW